MPRVLYAEDNDISRELTCAVLAAAGLEVVAVSGGADACAAFARAQAQGQRFDMVLLDLHMPDLSGYDVARGVRAHPSGALVPIVLLTGSVGDPDLQADGDLRINLTLLKPVTRHKLATLLALIGRDSGA